MKVVLVLTEGPEAGKQIEFNEATSFLVGRSSKAHLRFDRKADPRISRNHFLLDVRPPNCIITGHQVMGRFIKHQLSPEIGGRPRHREGFLFDLGDLMDILQFHKPDRIGHLPLPISSLYAAQAGLC